MDKLFKGSVSGKFALYHIISITVELWACPFLHV